MAPLPVLWAGLATVFSCVRTPIAEGRGARKDFDLLVQHLDDCISPLRTFAREIADLAEE